MKSQLWRRKTPPASTHRPPNDFRTRPVRVCTSASAFTFPPHALRPPAAAVIHNGLSTEKLSTSLLAALCKTFSPSRLRTRIYNIEFALAPLCHRAPRRRAQGGGGRRQRRTPPRAVPNHAACVPNHCAQRRKCTRQTSSLSVRSPRPCPPTAAPPPPKWEPRLRRREGKRPNGAPPHRNAHTPNAERKRYLHNSRTKTQRRTKRCAQFVIFVFTPCKLLHNFSTVLHRSPRNVPESAQIAARRSDFPCFTARFPNVLPESHRAKHPRIAPVLPPKNAPLRAYAKPRPHSRVRGTRQHATTCAFFTFSVRYERIGGT